MKLIEKVRGVILEAIALMDLLDEERGRLARELFDARAGGLDEGHVLHMVHRVAGQLEMRDELWPMLANVLSDLEALGDRELASAAEADREAAREECEAELHEQEAGEACTVRVTQRQSVDCLYLSLGDGNCSVTAFTTDGGELLALCAENYNWTVSSDSWSAPLQIRPETIARTSKGVSVTCRIVSPAASTDEAEARGGQTDVPEPSQGLYTGPSMIDQLADERYAKYNYIKLLAWLTAVDKEMAKQANWTHSSFVAESGVAHWIGWFEDDLDPVEAVAEEMQHWA